MHRMMFTNGTWSIFDLDPVYDSKTTDHTGENINNGGALTPVLPSFASAMAMDHLLNLNCRKHTAKYHVFVVTINITASDAITASHQCLLNC